MIDVNLYGQPSYRDGTTPKRCPITNTCSSDLILCYSFTSFLTLTILILIMNYINSGRCEHQALIDVMDSTNHMAMGGIKNTTYIATTMIPSMMDPKRPYLIWYHSIGLPVCRRRSKLLQHAHQWCLLTMGAKRLGLFFLSKFSIKPNFSWWMYLSALWVSVTFPLDLFLFAHIFTPIFVF